MLSWNTVPLFMLFMFNTAYLLQWLRGGSKKALGHWGENYCCQIQYDSKNTIISYKDRHIT